MALSGSFRPFTKSLVTTPTASLPILPPSPTGWEHRLVEFSVNDPTGTIGLCLEMHDLAFSKLAAGREKDIEFVRELLKHRLINRGKLLRLVQAEKHEEIKQELLRNWALATSKTSP
jgi:hypothetical protein